MNPELEHFIPRLIELHKQAIGSILDWSTLRDKLPDLPKPDREGLRLAMIKMGILEPSSPGNIGSTRLVDYYFDLATYKQRQDQEEEKKNIDYKLVKKQLEDYPIVKDRADDAIKISKLSLLVSGLGVILLVLKWKCGSPA